MLGMHRFARITNAVDRAVALAVAAHEGQVDKAGMPYILHPLRVMLQMDTNPERIVAVLHDVVEDCDVSFGDIMACRFSNEVIDAIMAVSRIVRGKEIENYYDFIRRAKRNVIGKKVKLADIEDNLTPERLGKLPPQEQESMTARYAKAVDILLEDDAP